MKRIAEASPRFKARVAGARGKHKVLVIDHVKNFPN
jgi:hypothetical protein